jgi:hypothetical protein
MRKFPLVAMGVVAAAVVGVAGFAVAQNHARTQTLTVRLPDGSVEQIRYTGDTAPRVVVSPRAPVVLASPVAAPFDWNSPFALIDQISAQMDRDSAALMRQLDALAMPGAGAPGFGLPGLTQGFAFASGLGVHGVCGKSVQVTQIPGQAASVVSRTWGDCGPAAKRSAHQAKAVPEAKGPKTSI